MKKYNALFRTGVGGEHKRVVIEAENSDEAIKKAYNMPEAYYYEEVMISERGEGTAAYYISYNYNYVFDGKVSDEIGENWIPINAENEEEAAAAWKKLFSGKYFKWLYPGEKNILDEIPTKTQGGKYGKIIEVFQWRSYAVPNTLNAKEILGK